MFKMEINKVIGGYKPISKSGFRIWLRCAANGLKFANTKEVLINYKGQKT